LLVVLVFLRDPALQDSIAAALSGLPATFETACERFPALLARARVAILVIPRLDDDAEIARFRRLAHSHPGKSWILVTVADQENVTNLIHWGGISEVTWLEQVSRDLSPIVRHLLLAGPISRFADFLQHSGMTSGEMVQFLRQACLTWPLPSTVEGLCRAVGVKESRIRYLWPGFFSAAHGLKGFLDTLVLAHSLELKDAEGSWVKVAKVLRIREETLRDICRRQTGLRLSEAHKKARGEGRDLLQEWWLRSRIS
jgi:hypothetical protein